MTERQHSINILEPDGLCSNSDSTISSSVTLGKLPNLGVSALTSIK